MKKYYQADLAKKEVPFEPIPDEVRAQYLRPGQLLAIHEKFPVAFQPIGTSMMLHIVGDCVNMRANDGQEVFELAMAGNVPFNEANAEEGRSYFEMEAEGLARFAQSEYLNIHADYPIGIQET